MNRSCGEKHTYLMFLITIFLNVFFFGGGFLINTHKEFLWFVLYLKTWVLVDWFIHMSYWRSLVVHVSSSLFVGKCQSLHLKIKLHYRRRYTRIVALCIRCLTCLCIIEYKKYSRVSFCDDSLLQPLSSQTEHSRFVVRHSRNSSVLSLLSALLALFWCACVSSILVQFF